MSGLCDGSSHLLQTRTKAAGARIHYVHMPRRWGGIGKLVFGLEILLLL